LIVTRLRERYGCPVTTPERSEAEEAARLEIAACLALGRSCKNTQGTILHAEEALGIAQKAYGESNEQVSRIRAFLAGLLQDSVEERKASLDVVAPTMEGLLDGTERWQSNRKRESDRLAIAVELECLQMKRVYVLKKLRRYRDARSEERRLAAFRDALVKAYLAYGDGIARSLADYPINGISDAGIMHEHWHLRDHLGFKSAELVRLYQRMGLEQEAVELERDGWKSTVTLDPACRTIIRHGQRMASAVMFTPTDVYHGLLDALRPSQVYTSIPSRKLR
jgi:hypothetical protein